MSALVLGDSVLAQEGQWFENRTTTGCVFYSDYEMSGRTFVWTGSCSPGAPIDGTGMLEDRSQPDSSGFFVIDRMSGAMRGGYWDGSVSTARFESSNGETWPAGAHVSQYNMGCLAVITDCTPGVVMAANDSGAIDWDNGSPRNEITNDYEPAPNLIESSNPPGFGEPAMASGGGRRSFINPETGDYCLQEQSTPPKVVTVYFEHSITLSNSCDQAIRVVITEEPDNRPTGRSYTRSVGANRTNSFSCLQANPNGSAAGMAGCAGFLGWDYAQ